jgi:hypothetical protein
MQCNQEWIDPIIILEEYVLRGGVTSELTEQRAFSLVFTCYIDVVSCLSWLEAIP